MGYRTRLKLRNRLKKGYEIFSVAGRLMHDERTKTHKDDSFPDNQCAKPQSQDSLSKNHERAKILSERQRRTSDGVPLRKRVDLNA